MRRSFIPTLTVLLLACIAAAAIAAVDPLANRRLAALRAQGPAGLQRLLDESAATLAKGPQPNDPAWRRTADAIDAVAAQRDAWASKIYWYTDLEQAKSAAAREGKPILSLRLLGKLDTELSCANSRFFRTTLYPDPRVNKLMREKFILHWSSERPVPVVTVDFGDGRTLKRTVTGNSIHYVLNADGQPIDALPGLYSAGEFIKQLNNALEIAAEKPTDARLREWHAAAAQKLEAGPPVAMVKEAFAPEVYVLARAKAAPPPNARAAGMRAASKGLVEDPLVRTLTELQTSVAQDTIQNEYRLHRQIHLWFAAGEPTVRAFEQLNERVYAELFLTPRSDPWLGLAPADAYPALEGGGIAQR
ncbi:MAG: hypothetical protein QOE14_283 [Humisphaera sp.]|nr:hypothetical protein [Humisphaera sp.]